MIMAITNNGRCYTESEVAEWGITEGKKTLYYSYFK